MTGTFVGMPAFPSAARTALADTQLRHNLAHATGTIRAKRSAVVDEVENWEDLRLAGAAEIEPRHFQVRADFDYRKKADRREFVRARLTAGDDGVPIAQKFAREGAGILSSMVQSDGLVELPEELTQLERDSLVRFLPFSEVGL